MPNHASPGMRCWMDDAMDPQDRLPDLVAAMAFDPLAGIIDLERHLEDMRADAIARGYAFDRHGVRNELQAATFRLRDARTLRLLLSPSGALAIEIAAPV